MTTFADLVDEVSAELHGMTEDLEQATFLTAEIGAADLTLQVDDASQLSRGLIEIGDELLWVTRIDPQNNNVTVAPFGRGYRGSGALTHAKNTAIVDNPRFPRASIKQKIQQTLSEIYPEIFVVKTDESSTVNPVQFAYPVPADCDTIITLGWKTIGPSQVWEPIRRYDLNTKANTATFPTGRCVNIGDRMVPGQTIRLTYIARPGTLTSATDTLDSTGLDDNVRDILVYGACYRLVAGLEIARLQNTTVVQGYDKTTYVGSTGAATAGSKYYLGIFQERLANERARLLQIYPSFTHLSR